jgi:hypothetical protein
MGFISAMSRLWSASSSWETGEEIDSSHPSDDRGQALPSSARDIIAVASTLTRMKEMPDPSAIAARTRRCQSPRARRLRDPPVDQPDTWITSRTIG